MIIYNFIDAETSQQEYELENIANAVQYRIYENVEPAARMARAIYTRSDLEDLARGEVQQSLDAFFYKYKYS